MPAVTKVRGQTSNVEVQALLCSFSQLGQPRHKRGSQSVYDGTLRVIQALGGSLFRDKVEHSE